MLSNIILTVDLVRHVVGPAIHRVVAPQLIGYAVAGVFALKPRTRVGVVQYFGPSRGETGAVTRFVGHDKTVLTNIVFRIIIYYCLHINIV